MFHFVDKRRYGGCNYGQISSLSKGNEWLLQRLSLLRSLEVHRGCVNSVVWDSSGELILSGSDDQHIVISDPWSGKTLLHQNTLHRANIFCAKFLPNSSNQRIVSCSGDGVIIYADLNATEDASHKFSCHVGTCYDVVTLPSDPNNFLTCGEDGTVRFFDLRRKTNCSNQNCQEDILLYMSRAVTALAVNPIIPYQMCVATQDSTIRIYDRRMLGTRAQDSYLEESNQALLMRLKPAGMEGRNNRVTSLKYSSLGDQVLASYSSDYLYLFDTQTFCDMPLEGIQDEKPTSAILEDTSDGPTLKRLRLRGDWSDTGPQAVPESELRNNASDVGQARPTLQSTLMQRMTDILSRMLQRPSVRRTLSESAQGAEDVEGENSNLIQGEDDSLHTDQIMDSIPDTLQTNQNVEEMSNTSSSNLSNEPHAKVNEPVSSNVSIEESSNLVNQREASASPTVSDNANPSLNAVINVTEESTPNNVTQSVPTNHTICTSVLPLELIIPPEILEEGNDLIVESQSSVVVDRSSSENVSDSTIDAHLTREDSLPSLSCGSRSDVSESVNNVENVLPIVEESDREIPQESNMNEVFASNISNIEATLVSMRQDFREKHSVDPSVDLSYSGIGASSGVISLGIGDELSRNCDEFDPLQNDDQLEAASSTESTSSIRRSKTPDIVASQRAIGTEKVSAVEPGDVSPAASVVEPHCSSGAIENSPSTSGAKSEDNPRAMRKRPSVCEGDAEDEATRRRRNTSSKMARAIDKAVQKIRGEEAARIDGPKGSIIPQGAELRRYKGHRNARTMIKEACFWGEDHVMSGSDCGRVFVWNKRSGRLVMLFEADAHVVNCLQPHPFLPILATSGIDYNVKLWAPVGERNFDSDKAEEISHRNEALLAETRDTITVPATFMIRMLASLNQIRQDRNRGQNPNPEEEDD